MVAGITSAIMPWNILLSTQVSCTIQPNDVRYVPTNSHLRIFAGNILSPIMIALDIYLYCLSLTTPGGGGCGSQDIELGVNGSRHSEQDISGEVGGLAVRVWAGRRRVKLLVPLSTRGICTHRDGVRWSDLKYIRQPRDKGDNNVGKPLTPRLRRRISI